jgi:hypothetical protein
MDKKTVDDAVGAKGVFVLLVLSRRNTTWQGRVDFPDGAGVREFESELDLLELIDKFILHEGAS